MEPQWQTLLSILLDEGELTEQEAQALKEALADPPKAQEAMEWLRLHLALQDHFAPTTSQELDLYRERLLAEALLREKGRIVRRPLAHRARWHWPALGAAALLALALGVWFLAPTPTPTPTLAPTPTPAPTPLLKPPYPEPQIAGGFEVIRGSERLPGSGAVARGDRLRTRFEVAKLEIGGYCRIEMAPFTEIRLVGEPRKEVIELAEGQVRATIDPGRGGFQILTARGAVEAKGTEFIVSITNPFYSEGGGMKPEARSLPGVVTVAVLSGLVVCHFGEDLISLGTGQSYVYAGNGEEGKTTGKVVSTGENTFQLQSGEKTLTFRAGVRNKLAQHEVSQLKPGDTVTVRWVAEGERLFVEEIEGTGTVAGTVTEIGGNSISVKDADGKTHKFIPRWIGGMPADGGGLDKEMLKKIKAQKVGAKVRLSWDLVEGKRLVGIETAE